MLKDETLKTINKVDTKICIQILQGKYLGVKA